MPIEPDPSTSPGGEAIAPALPAPGVHAGWPLCHGLLRQALLALAPASGQPAAAVPLSPREVWLVDDRFDGWPLDEPEVLAVLTAWLRPGGRRLQLIGLDFDASARGLPRFSRWRRDWSHALAVHRPVDGMLAMPLRGLLAGPLWLQWLESADGRLRVSQDPTAASLARFQLADFLQRCEPAWPPTTLGL